MFPLKKGGYFIPRLTKRVAFANLTTQNRLWRWPLWAPMRRVNGESVYTPVLEVCKKKQFIQKPLNYPILACCVGVPWLHPNLEDDLGPRVRLAFIPSHPEQRRVMQRSSHLPSSPISRLLPSPVFFRTPL